MDLPLPKLFLLLPWGDWLAVLLFFVGWVGYAMFAKRRAHVRPSILASTNRWRGEWMRQVVSRENRIVDAAVTQSLSAAPSFFANTCILILGGLVAALASTEKASELVRELPFAARTSMLVFDLKLALMAGVFTYAFFRFTWSVRQYSFGAIIVGAVPPREQLTEPAERERFIRRSSQVMALAAESFNDGLRAFYFSFAAAAWLFSAWAFMAATAGVVWVLYRREFHSEVLRALNGDPGDGG